MRNETEPVARLALGRRAASIALACATALAGLAHPTRAALAASAVLSAPRMRAPRDGGAGAFGSGAAVALEEQSLPPEDLPSPAASPAASPAPPGQSPGGAGDSGAAAGASPAAQPAGLSSPDASSDDASAGGWTRVPAGAGGAAVSAAPPASGSSGPVGTPATGAPAEAAGAPVAGQPAPEATPTDAPPPYDVGSIQPTAPISDQPLTALIASTKDQPALNASLRFAEDGRKALENSKLDDAIRDLGRAISIDPTDPYAYFYLGRAYMMKKDYPQALAFFGRSEVGVRAVPAWLGEVKTFEGACLEEQGKFSEAAAAYKQALDVAPGNLMARTGYGRLNQSLSDVNAGNAAPPPPPLDGAALPAPEVNLAAPPPVEEGPPPAEPQQPDSAADSSADSSDDSSGAAGGQSGGSDAKDYR